MSSVDTSEPPRRESKHAMKLRHKSELAALTASFKSSGALAAFGGAKKLKTAEAAMIQRQTEELKNADKDNAETDTLPAPSALPAAVARSSARKQRKKAAATSAAVSDSGADIFDARADENARLQRRLRSLGLSLYDIAADGNCMFRSVAYAVDGTAETHRRYRRLAADHIAQRFDQFAPFITDDNGDPVSEGAAHAYVDKLADADAADIVWGGHTELVALAAALDTQIQVVAADGDIKVGDKDDRNIKIVFHRHLFGLGNHYSAVTNAQTDGDHDREHNEHEAENVG